MQKSRWEEGKEYKSGWLLLSSPKSFKVKALNKKTGGQKRGKSRTTQTALWTKPFQLRK